MQYWILLTNQFYLGGLILCTSFATCATSLSDASVESACNLFSGANVIGLAIERDSKETLYCEYHFDEYDSNVLSHSVVKYIDINSQQIAEKQLDYSFVLLAPNVLQRDIRQGELRAMTYSAENKKFLLEYKKNKHAKKQSAIVDLQDGTPPVVADAGFDMLIKKNWNALLSGIEVVFSFLSPIHSRDIILRVSLDRRKTCGGNVYNAEQSACFSVKPKSALLKLFAKPLFLSYNKATQKLEVFSGVVNLVDAQGQSKVANIYYWHKP